MLMNGRHVPAAPSDPVELARWSRLCDSTPLAAIDPCTGCVLRPATELEAAAFRAQPVHPAFRLPLRLGDVTIVEHTEPVTDQPWID